MRTAAMVLFAFAACWPEQAVAQAPVRQELQSPAAFQSITDRAERSRAMFAEIGKLITHPRCMNCHPAGDQPLQGAEHRPHLPPTQRERPGYVGPACASCHTDRNYRDRELQEHPRSSALAARSDVDGLAGQVARRYLPAVEGQGA